MSDIDPDIRAWPGLARRFNQFNGFYARRRHQICVKSTREFMKPICTYIRNYKGPAVEMELACKRLIKSIVCEHQVFNSIRCEKKLKHHALYAAAHVAFACRLSDSGTVAYLLNEIYNCDGTFWSLLSGAFGDTDANLFDSDESIDVFEYFLHQASKERMEFIYEGIPKRMADLTLLDSNSFPAAVLHVYMENFELFKILIQYGLKCYEVRMLRISTVMRLTELYHGSCEWAKRRLKYKELLLRAYPASDGRLPTLKELTKVAVRNILYDNHQLPRGINELEIPQTLKMYLNLEF